jgi:hypothetical protein
MKQHKTGVRKMRTERDYTRTTDAKRRSRELRAARRVKRAQVIA